MLPSADRSERYALESLQPRILLSADVEVALDAEEGVQDTFVALEVGVDDGRLYKGEVEEEVFVDPDGIEYVQSDLYRTLEITEEAPVDDGMMYTCGFEELPFEGEVLVEEELVDPMIYTCYLPTGEVDDDAVVEEEVVDPNIYTCYFPVEDGVVAEEEVVEVVDEELVDPIIYTCYFPLPEESAPAEEETPADDVLQVTVELTAAEEEAPAAAEEAAVAAPESDEVDAGADDEVNPLLSDSDDLLIASDELLA